MNDSDKSMVHSMEIAFEEGNSKAFKYEDVLNTKNGKIIAVYYSQLISKYNSIYGLILRGEYDAVYLIARHYLENYAILCELIKRLIQKILNYILKD